jgi:hypothetical protein
LIAVAAVHERSSHTDGPTEALDRREVTLKEGKRSLEDSVDMT